MKFSLATILAISLAGLQFVAILLVVTTSYVTSERAMLHHARGQLEKASQNTIEHTRGFLSPAREAAVFISRVVENSLISTDKTYELEQFLFDYLQTAPDVFGAFFGSKDGDFVYVSRLETEDMYQTKIVSIDGEIRTTTLIVRNAEYEVVEKRFDPSDTYDPRTRPWYQGASQKRSDIWTDPYIFFSSQEPGITVASPVQTNAGDLIGAVGIDIKIHSISGFLADLELSENGAALILNRNGDIIAHPDPSQTKTTNENGDWGFVNINDMEHSIARAAFSSSATDDAVGQFEYGAETYISSLSPISVDGLPWTIATYAPENDFTQDIKDNRRRNTWIAAIVSICSAIFGVALAELILRPVRAFAVRTALVSQGEMSPTAPLPQTYRELKRANETLINEIAQRRESETKIQELNRDLSHVTRVNMMGQMATGLAHELSQPLTAITQNVDAAISTAKHQTDTNPELLEILHELDEQAHRGGDIIRALRGFVRKDEGVAKPFDLDELVTQTFSLIQREIKVHHVKTTFDIVDIPPILGNRVQIAQVLTNLTRNAIEAMEAAQSPVRSIHIHATKKRGGVTVRVADSGPGVAPDLDLFKRFETSKTDGMGLGLSICRTIVEVNGGRMWYDPDTASFYFTLRT